MAAQLGALSGDNCLNHRSSRSYLFRSMDHGMPPRLR